MNIVPHSVSNYEFILQPNEWRIVFLFRNVWDKNVKYFNNDYEEEKEEEEDQMSCRKRNRKKRVFEIVDLDIKKKKQKKRSF